uniref:TIL domain-containing protein n=1 Tax=Globodera pallida TaxID=36090 RepID=A0A183BMK9_GLOPA
MLFLSTIFFVLTFVSGKTTKVEKINSGNRQNFVLSDEDHIFADFKEFLKSGKATEKATIDWALINGCKIVVGELRNKSKYGGSQLRLEEQQIQNALANGQNAKQKVALFKFGALIKAFLNELPEEQAKSALVKLLASKQQGVAKQNVDYDCDCPPNEEHGQDSCNGCEPNCDNPQPDSCTLMFCSCSCDCKKGLLRNSHTKQCIPQEQCPTKKQ